MTNFSDIQRDIQVDISFIYGIYTLSPSLSLSLSSYIDYNSPISKFINLM